MDAPLFQTVFLAPGDNGDGTLRAHEVLGLDLRGLEPVTLGACETALGRIDLSDNLRGLPAALLLAGARAVIGTLWEVSGDASEHDLLHAAVRTPARGRERPDRRLRRCSAGDPVVALGVPGLGRFLSDRRIPRER